MNFGELRAEVLARGYDYVAAARVNRWINMAYDELCSLMPWPFLETTVTGSTPLTITDLGRVLSITDTTGDRGLELVPRSLVVLGDPDLNDTGSPYVAWLENNTLNVSPASSSAQVSVRYTKVPADLVADGDTPVVPARFHDIIVDGAVCRAQKDNDGYDSMAATRQEWQRQVDLMVVEIMGRNQANSGQILQFYGQDY